MRIKYFKLYGFLLVIFIMVMTINGLAVEYKSDETGQELIFRVPTGEKGIHYEGEGVPEMQKWGPPAFTIAPDGRFWIADTVANRLIQYTSTGELADIINLEGKAVGVNDIKVTEKGIWVLDSAAVVPAALYLTFKGDLNARYEIPNELHHGLSGLNLGQDNVVVECFGGAELYRLVETDGIDANCVQAGYSHKDLIYCANPVSPTEGGIDGKGTIMAGDTLIQISTPNTLGGLRILGFGLQDSFYVIAEEVALVEGIIRVDQTVHWYDQLGNLLGLTRIPLADQYTYVDHGLAVGPDGRVYALYTRPDGAEIRRLEFIPELKPILPDPLDASYRDIDDVSGILNSNYNREASSISRQAIIDNAWAFITNSKYLNSTNVSGVCSERGKPRYLSGAGTYPSVPYDWGGSDSPSEFNSYMHPNNYKAGDITAGTSYTCSRGVDCSGFVQRAWGLPASPKYSATLLVNISKQLSSVNELQRGDIMNCVSVHVVLFSNFAVNGFNAIESTTANNLDRVTNLYRSWSWVSNGPYKPYRYNNVSNDLNPGYCVAEYYNNRNLSGKPSIYRSESLPIDHNWGYSGPGGSLGSDNFSARWTGRASFNAGNYTFIARTDDGMRVWLDGQLILDKWFNQVPTEYRVTRNMTAGIHNIQVDYYESSGEAVAQFRWEQIGGSPCPIISNWKGEYWNNRTLSGSPVLCRNDYSVNFNWGSGGPGSRVPNDNFSARWTQNLSLSAGTYRFHVRADDGIRLWLDGNLVINEWRDQFTTEYSIDRTLNTGLHSLKIEYYESYGGAVAQFWYEKINTNSGNLALNRQAFATSYQAVGYEPYRGNDGKTSTRWSSRQTYTLGDEWWLVDLGAQQNFNTAIIRWEAAYATQHFVGWSNDGVNFTGYWFNISSGVSYRYNLGNRNARYVGILMRTPAPNMTNYSFWESEIYQYSVGQLNADEAMEAQETGKTVIEIMPPSTGSKVPLIW